MDVKPILFSGPMVRALLEGRKTQTRRLMKQQEALSSAYAPIIDGGTVYNYAGEEVVDQAHFAVGDLLWVREKFHTANVNCWPDLPKSRVPSGGAKLGKKLLYDDQAIYFAASYDRSGKPTYHPAIHMPRWASRLTLEVTDVRVQRLQEISIDDTDAEVFGGDFPHIVLPELFPDADKAGELSLPECFSLLWDSINASRGFGWDANPWVAAISFRVHPMNIDEFIAANHAMEGAVWPTPAS